MKKWNGIYVPDDMFTGEENHPQCCFFGVFPSSQDPDEDYYSYYYCHMARSETPANKCKGDYIGCPLAAVN